MIYPEHFETKIGFDRIRELVKGHCLFDPGKERVDKMTFMQDHDAILHELKLVEEFQEINLSEEEFPIQHFVDNREALQKAEVEGRGLENFDFFGFTFYCNGRDRWSAPFMR